MFSLSKIIIVQLLHSIHSQDYIISRLLFGYMYIVYNVLLYIYVTAGMDISVGTVSACPNLIGRMDSGMNTNI